MTFLGIKFNSCKMSMEVTEDRMAEISEELKNWSTKQRASRREIQSLAGKLMFIAKCCKHGRSFMARILSAIKRLKRSNHHTYLNAEFKKDVQWWIHFLPHFHTVSMIKTAPWSDIDKVIATDSCIVMAGLALA
jgi:hypothetical protein